MQSGIKESKKQRFKEAIIELSQNCNLSCIMCGFGQQQFDKSKFITFNQFKNIVDKVAPHSDTIRLNGRGESTIHPDFVKMLRYTSEHYPDCQINLFTNLSFCNNNLLEEFMNSGIQLFISFDSNNEKELLSIRKGANYNWILSNLERLKESQIRPFVIFTMQESNLHRLSDIAVFAKKYNCNLIYNTVRRDEGIEDFVEQVILNKERIIEDFKFIHSLFLRSELNAYYPKQISGVEIESESSIKSHGEKSVCPSLGKEICVLYNGDVTPCNMFNPYVLGNLIDQDIDEIYQSSEFNEFVSNHKSYYYCKNCSCLSI